MAITGGSVGGSCGGGGDGAVSTARPTMMLITPHEIIGCEAALVMAANELSSALVRFGERSAANAASLDVVMMVVITVYLTMRA